MQVLGHFSIFAFVFEQPPVRPNINALGKPLLQGVFRALSYKGHHFFNKSFSAQAVQVVQEFAQGDFFRYGLPQKGDGCHRHGRVLVAGSFDGIGKSLLGGSAGRHGRADAGSYLVCKAQALHHQPAQGAIRQAHAAVVKLPGPVLQRFVSLQGLVDLLVCGFADLAHLLGRGLPLGVGIDRPPLPVGAELIGQPLRAVVQRSHQPRKLVHGHGKYISGDGGKHAAFREFLHPLRFLLCVALVQRGHQIIQVFLGLFGMQRLGPGIKFVLFLGGHFVVNVHFPPGHAAPGRAHFPICAGIPKIIDKFIGIIQPRIPAVEFLIRLCQGFKVRVLGDAVEFLPVGYVVIVIVGLLLVFRAHGLVQVFLRPLGGVEIRLPKRPLVGGGIVLGKHIIAHPLHFLGLGFAEGGKEGQRLFPVSVEQGIVHFGIIRRVQSGLVHVPLHIGQGARPVRPYFFKNGGELVIQRRVFRVMPRI